MGCGASTNNQSPSSPSKSESTQKPENHSPKQEKTIPKSAPVPLNITNKEEILKAISLFLSYKPTQKSIDSVIKYLTESTNPVMARGIHLLFERNHDSENIKLNECLAKLKLSGEVAQWEEFGFNKKTGDPAIGATDGNKPMGTKENTDLIKSYAVVTDKDFIYLMVEPVAKGEKYHYRINLCFNGGIGYAPVWCPGFTCIQEWDPKTGGYVKNLELPPDCYMSSNGKVMEAKIPLKLLKSLPNSFSVNVVAWQDFKNLYTSYNDCIIYEQQVFKMQKMSLLVLCKYAESIEITLNNPFPLAQAICEGFIYKISEDSIKDQIIKDGLKMIEESQIVMKNEFRNQKKLSELTNFENILAWSCRLIIYGGYNVDFYRNKQNLLTLEAYRFCVFDPTLLAKCRELIAKNNLLDPDLQTCMKKIETYVTSTQKYRRTELSTMKKIYDAFPNDFWKEQYEGQKAEEDANDMHISEVNSSKIHKGANWSSTFQIEYLYRNGKTYGNCVDVAGITIAFHKSVGIPSFHITYHTISEKNQEELHTFPVYYESLSDKWYNFTRNGNAINDEKVTILYRLNRPQIGSYYKSGWETIKGQSFIITSRMKVLFAKSAEWNKLNIEGIPNSDFLKYFDEY